MSSSAETVMNYEIHEGESNKAETAKKMREDYLNLLNRLKAASYSFSKADATSLYIAATVMISQLEDRIKNLKQAMVGYQTDVMPKLGEIIDNAKDDNEARLMAGQKFNI